MPVNLSEDQHHKLDQLIGGLLDSYQSGELSKGETIGAFAHIITAAVIGNTGEVLSWIERPEVLEDFRQMTLSNGMGR